MAKATVTGVEAIAKAFRDLPKNLARKVIRQALRKAEKIPYAAVKRTAPVRTGKGVKTVRVRSSKGPKGAIKRDTISVVTLIGHRRGKGWYMSLQNFGWTTGKRIREGRRVVGRIGRVRKVEGKRFMDHAFRQTEEEVKEMVINEIVSGIAKAVK